MSNSGHVSLLHEHGVDQVRPHAGASAGIGDVVRPARHAARHVELLGIFLWCSGCYVLHC
jgi:hypothetical protein